MAYTASPVQTLPFTLGTGPSAMMGQGNKPELWALMSFSDATVSPPVWTDVTVDARNFSVTRGGDAEQSEMEAGTATLELDNRDGTYDPSIHASVRVMNRLKLFERFSGATNPMFTGWVESYELQWPGGGFSDHISIANAVDETKVLGLDRLPVMDPPRDSYADLVGFDNPNSYYRWSDDHLTSSTTVETIEMPTIHWTYNGFEWDTETRSTTVTSYQDWIVGAGVGFQSTYSDSAIVGDLQDLAAGTGGNLVMQPTGPFRLDANSIQVGDPDGGSAATYETWFRKTGNPGSNTGFLFGPESTTAGVRTWQFVLTTTGTVQFQINDSGGTTRTATSTTTLANDTWYHLTGELDGTTLRIFVNGVQEGTAAVVAGAFRPTNTAGATAAILGIAGVTALWIDETAFYNSDALPVARALAHYEAGALRGFRGGTVLGLPHLRAGQVLDSVSSTAPRNIRVGTRGLQPVFQHGQPPLEELRKYVLAEMPNGRLFVARDGTLTLLDADHRTVAPWNTTQMSFGDEGIAGEWPYETLAFDYSDSFLANEWNGSRTGGTLQTVEDAPSIADYKKRSRALGDLPLVQDSDVADILAGLLGKSIIVALKATALTLNMADLNVLEGVFRLELCDKIHVSKRRVGGTIGQTAYIQKIEVTGSNDQKPWTVRLGVAL